MLLYFLFLIISIILSSLGLTYYLISLNVLTLGYTFSEYIHFISSNLLFWSFPLGIIILVICIYLGGHNELHL